MICGKPSVEMDKLLKKQLADYAKRIDNMIAMTEKDCYDKGYLDAVSKTEKEHFVELEILKDLEA
jgi:hypothetical protein